jgi:hypothetical protein
MGASQDPFNLKRKGAWGASFKDRRDSAYHVVFNDYTVETVEAKRWTIMHEIGHILLGHLDDFQETALYRKGLSEEEYQVLETEANYFAAEFLMPRAIICGLDDVTARDIQYLFFVSIDASNNRYKDIFEEGKNWPNALDQKIRRNFYSFLIRKLDYAVFNGIHRDARFNAYSENKERVRRCPSCYGFINKEKDSYCHHCGKSLDTKSFTNTQWRQLGEKPFTPTSYIFRLGFKTPIGKDNDTFVFCPVCLNHEITESSRYCKICGQPLSIRCHTEGKVLDNVKRFCPDCGEPTWQKDMIDLS